MGMLLSPARRLINRRQSLGFAAWAFLVAGCHAQEPGGGGGGVGQSLADPLARRFYQQRGWQAAWDQGSEQQLQQAIADARRHGLTPAAFAPKPAASGAGGHDESLTAAALDYARALSSGFVDPRKIEPIFTLHRNEVDLAAGLGRALQQQRLADWLGSLAPADDEYKALSGSYLAALGQAGLPDAPAQGAPVGRSTAPSDQARQLAANLERRRWLARSPAARRIDVNTAGAFLDYFNPGQATTALRVVCGRDDHPTPSIEASFHKLIANPPWRVPAGIAKKEILPKGAAYMSRQGMRVVAGGLVEQAPGPKCALGRVKFDVEDPYDIYLHDTPAKSWFAQPERHRSHGCVRVQNAVDFARGIAGQEGKADDFDQALASQDTKEVELGTSIPVRLLYHTAYLDQGGQVMLAPDVYGTDETLASALGFGQAAAAARRQEPPEELGP